MIQDHSMRAFISASVLLLISVQPPSGQQPLSLVQSIELPRVEGRIDHLALDATGQKLFVAALGNNTVEVVDVKSGRHVKSLPDFRGPQGIAGVPDAHLIAVANGQGEGLQTIDASDYQLGKAISLGEDADNVRYDAATKKLYVGYGNGALAAISPADGKVLGTVKLSGHPESFQLERTGPGIFVNVPTAAQIAVVDRSAMKVIATWPVSNAKSNFPMALDEANHRMFVGCRQPAKVLVYDTTSGKEIGGSDTVGDTDDLFYDAQRKRLYVTGGGGFIDVFDTTGPATLVLLARVKTADGARTSLFVPEQGRLYLAVPHRGAQRAEIRTYEIRP
jgi:DNA-binding beta-propeller fold protein YncE